MNFILVSFFFLVDFFSSNLPGQTGGRKAMHKSPPCMITGGLKMGNRRNDVDLGFLECFVN